MIVISKCLLGCNCTYSGKNNYNKEIAELCKTHDYIVVCPEVLGGLSIPRTPCEIVDGKVIDINGIDKTYEYHKGAKIALKECLDNDVDLAILKYRSPSCGKGLVYDGTFSHRVVEGNGVFVDELLKHNIVVYNENEIESIKEYLEGE